MRSYVCAVPVKLLALACTLTGVFMTAGIVCPFLLVILALLFLAAQRKWRLVCLYGIFYLLLSLILYGIRFYGLHLLVFSEFYVLMLWNLSPVFLVSWDLITTPPGDLSAFLAKIHAPISFILGSLVVFRFFPTMRIDGVSLCIPAQKMFYCGDERGNGITFFRLSDNAGNRQIFAYLDRFQIEFLRDNRARNEFIALALSVLDDVQVKR